MRIGSPRVVSFDSAVGTVRGQRNWTQGRSCPAPESLPPLRLVSLRGDRCYQDRHASGIPDLPVCLALRNLCHIMALEDMFP